MEKVTRAINPRFLGLPILTRLPALTVSVNDTEKVPYSGDFMCWRWHAFSCLKPLLFLVRKPTAT